MQDLRKNWIFLVIFLLANLTLISSINNGNETIPEKHLMFMASSPLPVNTSESKAQLNSTKIASSPNVYIEGGPVNATKDMASNMTKTNFGTNNASTHEEAKISRPYGREHITESSKAFSTTERVILVDEKLTVEEPEHKKIVPRKGAVLADFNSTTSNDSKVIISSTTSTTTMKPEEKKARKPLVTEDNGDKPYPASHFVSSSKNNTKNLRNPPSLEYHEFSRQKSSGSDYIIPIVGVILSVPLVAILLNVVYKRTKEWWYHRHYRRMDFLVDGMYNN